jgi:hypothetical protein
MISELPKNQPTRQSPFKRRFERMLLIVPLLVCIWTGLQLSCVSLRCEAQGVNATEQIDVPSVNKTATPDVQHVPVIVSKGFDESRIFGAMSVLRLILAACGVYIIWLAFAQRKGTFNLFTPFCGQLLLIDAALFEGQLNWWLASNGSAYDPSIGLALPGVLGSVLICAFVIALPTDQRRAHKIILTLIALALLVASLCLANSVWPAHPN